MLKIQELSFRYNSSPMLFVCLSVKEEVIFHIFLQFLLSNVLGTGELYYAEKHSQDTERCYWYLYRPNTPAWSLLPWDQEPPGPSLSAWCCHVLETFPYCYWRPIITHLSVCVGFKSTLWVRRQPRRAVMRWFANVVVFRMDSRHRARTLVWSGWSVGAKSYATETR